MEPADFTVRYQSWTALRLDDKNQFAHNGLFLRTQAELKQFQPVVIKLIIPSNDEFVLNGQVLQAMPGQGLAIQFDSKAGEQLAEISRVCSQHDDEQTAPDSKEDPVVSTPGEENPSKVDDRQTLPQRIESMSVAEKRRTALHGRKDERLLLIRDRNKTIHPFVLKNPAITLDEIEQFARMPSVNPDALRMMAKHPDWTRSATVCRNLVRNPKTPLREALALLDKLPKSDVRALAKSSNVRTPIQQAARRKVLK
jgi:hypothetical protein